VIKIAADVGRQKSDLSYQYYTATNRLKSDSDLGDTSSKLGDFNHDLSAKGALDYGYDDNGKDEDKS